MVRPFARLRRNRRRSIAGAVAVTIVAVAATVSSFPWRAAAQRPAADNSVRLLEPGKPQTFEKTDDRGATYYWLDGLAMRASTRFADAVAITERDSGGDLRTRLTDLAGNEVATLRVDKTSAAAGVLDYREPGADPVRASARPDLLPTIDWGNQQAYALWKDQYARRGGALEWQGRLMRSRGAGPRDVSADVVDVRVEWPDGFASTSERRRGRRPHVHTGAPLRGASFVSRLQRHGVDVGYSQWYVEEQVFEWSFPGLTEGYLDAKRLEEIGGWPFTPDLAWINVQNFAFHRLAAEERAGVARQQPGWFQRAIAFVAPTLSANEPGCDYLHWLDGSVVRFCCDVHDYYYMKAGCSWRSWWQIWSSWRCDVCNVTAVYCFATGGKLPFRQSPW